jgi:hypothetical protein
MTRIAVICAIFFAACDVGSVATNNQGGPDGGTGGSDSGSAGSDCEAVNTANAPNGHHNAGLSCMTVGCHLIGNAGAGAPEYSYAGTLYKDLQGTQPYGGATVSIVVGGQTYKMITATTGDAGDGAGNFFIPAALATPSTAAMTATTKVSACPNTMPMATPLVDNGGNCNNCHANPPSQGAAGKVYVP